MPTFAGLANIEGLTATYGSLQVRPAMPGDEERLYALLTSPDTPFVDMPIESAASLRHGIDVQTEIVGTGFDELPILCSIVHHDVVVGSLSALIAGMTPLGLPDGDVPSVEYTMYVEAASRRQGLGSRSVLMLEPLLVSTWGIQQVIAQVKTTNVGGLATVADFERTLDLADDYALFRREPLQVV